jgi:zeaxanthin glucosyltransferase
MQPHGEAIRRGAKALGIGERSSLIDCLSPTLQLSQTTAGFDFPRTRLPAHFHHVGPLRPALADESPLALPVQSDKPFVFASLGTLQGGRFRLFERIAKACRQLDAQLLVAHCGRLDAAQCWALEEAGARWVTDFAPQRAAVARADVVVTHAGLNTVLDALVAGTPMLALPIAFDQGGAAARIVHAGAGLRLIPALAPTGSIRRGLARLLAEPSFGDRAATLGAEVASAGGTRAAADLIERTLGVTNKTEVAHAG